jgi:drug/metabolite transporter (DMT)-like permease
MAPFAVARIGPEVRRMSRRELALIAGSGVFLGLHFIAWIESLYLTSVASATVILATTPLFVALIGFLVLGERLSRGIVLAIFVAVVGTLVMAWGDLREGNEPGSWLLGNGLALLGAVLQGCYLLCGRVVRQGTSWLVYVFPLYTVAALTTLAAALIRQVPLFGYSPRVYIFCAALALGPQLLGHGTFNYVLRYVTAALLALMGLLQPVGASLLAAAFFGEIPRPLALSGMFVVLGAVAFALYLRVQASRGRDPYGGGT